jgi:hypothetical protein
MDDGRNSISSFGKDFKEALLALARCKVASGRNDQKAVN